MALVNREARLFFWAHWRARRWFETTGNFDQDAQPRSAAARDAGSLPALQQSARTCFSIFLALRRARLLKLIPRDSGLLVSIRLTTLSKLLAAFCLRHHDENFMRLAVYAHRLLASIECRTKHPFGPSRPTALACPTRQASEEVTCAYLIMC